MVGIRIVRGAIAAFGALGWVGACADGSRSSAPAEFAVGLVLSPDSATVVLRGAVQLSPFSRDADGSLFPIDSGQVTWTSSDRAVASVNLSGLVTGLHAGSATITASWRGHRASATVTVVRVSFAAISAGRLHTCGVTVAGGAFCWGYGWDGQLGSGTLGNVSVPTAVAGGLTFTTVSVAETFSCSLADGGVLYCWGAYFGTGNQCQNPRCSTTPVAIAGALRFTAISTNRGEAYVCGLTAGGAAYCFHADTSLNPVAVGTGLSFIALDVGSLHACALTTDGAAYCWGDNRRGQLGTGDRVSSSSPRAVAGGLTFAALSAGEENTCALTSNGAAYCWGRGHTIDGYVDDYGLTPVPVMAGFTFVALSGGYVTCGLDSLGGIQCWVGPTGSWTIPGGLVFRKLGVGLEHACALTAEPVAYCWGRNSEGQLGNGTMTELGEYSNNPVRVVGQE